MRMLESPYLDLFDFRRRVFAMYRERNEALQAGEDPSSVLGRFRSVRDALFASHPQSALSDEDRERLTGLPYYPYNPAARVEATIRGHAEPEPRTVGTSGEEAMPMRAVGTLDFTFEQSPAGLTLYWIDVYGGGLFLPFRDTTAPDETYGGGRYLFDTVKGSDFLWRRGGDGETILTLDFNYAYNPSCAYDHRWSCPLAPLENRLQFPVRAGERRFEGSGPSGERGG